jgi:hypothetical protein
MGTRRRSYNKQMKQGARRVVGGKIAAKGKRPVYLMRYEHVSIRDNRVQPGEQE